MAGNFNRHWVGLRVVVGLAAVALAAGGCGEKPPYRVSESRQLSARELERLGHIDLARVEPAGPVATQSGQSAGSAPRVWIGVPDRRAEGAITGAVLGAAAGAVIGGIAASGGTGMFAGLAVMEGAILIGAPVGAVIGAPLGALTGRPGEGNRRAAAALRRIAQTVDVAAAARDGAVRASALAKNHQSTTRSDGRAGGKLSVDVLAYGTRAAGGGKAQPFVAVRTRLAEAAGGKVLYDTTSDWRGPKKYFHRWDDDGGAEFRRLIETGAADLGRRSARRALTPGKGRG